MTPGRSSHRSGAGSNDRTGMTDRELESGLGRLFRAIESLPGDAPKAGEPVAPFPAWAARDDAPRSPSRVPPGCEGVMREIDDLVSGLLPPHDADRVRDHLGGCSDCAEEEHALRAVTAALPPGLDLEPPPGTFENILARIAELPNDVLDGGGDAAAPRPLVTPARLGTAHSLDAARARLAPARLARAARAVGVGGLAAAAAMAASVVLLDGSDRGAGRGVPTAPAPITRTATTHVGDPVAPATALRPGERAVERVAIRFPDVDLDDGLRRRRRRAGEPAGAVAVPAGFVPGDGGGFDDLGGFGGRAR